MACSNQMLCLVFSVLSLVLLCTIDAAPLHKSNKLNSITNSQSKSLTHKRSVPESRHDTKLSLVINDEAADSDILNNNRNKRSVDETEHLQGEEHHTDRHSSSRSSSRSKRSAAWFLGAAIKLCDNHPQLCKTIQVEDKDVKMTIRLEEI